MSDRELLLERLKRLAIVLDELMPQCAELVRDTIDLLKEQDAVKPVRDKKTGRIWLCGKCGSYVGFEDHDEDDPNEFDKFCRECGHPVLWEGR